MSTFSQLIDDTLTHLYGYTTVQDQSTHLTASATISASSMGIADSTAVSRGVVEIGEELIWVDSVNTSTSSVVIAPYGRGFRGTTAAAYPPGTRVITSPIFPRYVVKNALNDSIRSVFPQLYGIGFATFSYQPSVNTYALPVGAVDVLAVAWQTTGPSKEWLPVRRWRVDDVAAPAIFTSGVSVSVYDAIVPGRTIKISYTKQPNVLVNSTDDFVTVTGLPASTEDVVRLGAAYRLVPFFDSAHLSGQSAEADFAAAQRPQGSSASLGRFLLQMYQVRLAEESGRLSTLNPIRSHYTR